MSVRNIPGGKGPSPAQERLHVTSKEPNRLVLFQVLVFFYFEEHRNHRKKVNSLSGLVVRDPGYTMEMYCASCEVQTEFIYVM
jgi:hypothetical protein